MEKTKVECMTIGDDDTQNVVVAVESKLENETHIGGFSVNLRYAFYSHEKNIMKKFFTGAFIRNELKIIISGTFSEVTFFSGEEKIELEKFQPLISDVTTMMNGPAGVVKNGTVSFNLDRRSIKKLSSLFVEQV